MKKILITGMIFTVVGGLGLGSSSAFAWTKYHEGVNTVPSYINSYSGLATESRAAVHNANSQWNAAGRGDLIYQASTLHTNTTYPLKNNRNDITTGSRGTNDYLMQTQPWVNSSGKAVEIDIDINVSHPWANNGSSNAYDVGNAITHEIGHLLGLDHSTDKEATMYASAALGETKKRTIELDDKNGIRSLY